MPKRFSSVVGRSFGDGVRDAIQAAGLTQRKVAELLGWEEAKVSDLVKGKGGVTEVELAMLLGLCGVKPDEARRLLALFKETREKGYLQFDDGGLLGPLRTLVEQERLCRKSTGAHFHMFRMRAPTSTRISRGAPPGPDAAPALPLGQLVTSKYCSSMAGMKRVRAA